MPKSGAYTAAKFLLEIEGKTAGFLYSVDGGEAYADPVSEDPPVDGVIRKHPGPVRYAPLVLTCGAGMTPSFYDWIAKVADGTQTPRDGAVVFLDYNYREVIRLDFDQALATEVVFPAGDAAVSKEIAYLTLTLKPQATRRHKGHAGMQHAGVFGKFQKKWLPSNFRFDVDQLPTKKVARVEPIVVKQALSYEPGPSLAGPVDVSAVVFSLSEADADPVYAWHEDFEHAAAVIGRLLSTEAIAGPEPSEEPRRARGRALGRAWASGRAGLDELLEVAELDGKGWSAVALAEGHSLISSLREHGLLPSEEWGPMELDRDPFVEGLVDGVAAVHEQLTPDLVKLTAEPDELSTLKLQSALDRMNKLLETLSNILKKMSDTQSSIVQNLK